MPYIEDQLNLYKQFIRRTLFFNRVKQSPIAYNHPPKTCFYVALYKDSDFITETAYAKSVSKEGYGS
jgi:hypothetical protein